MTTDPDDPERDAAVAKAWREHSAELPPAHLDAAILAAARRAVPTARRRTPLRTPEQACR